MPRRSRGKKLALEPEIRFELAGGPYAVTAARLALADLDSKMDPSTAFDIRLLVSELVTNSVQHASVGAEDSIRLHVKIKGEIVRVEVSDNGPGFEPGDPTPNTQTDSGWGLFLVNQLADSWGVDKEAESCVWFEIDRTGREQPGQTAA
jgi:anti-sigma regulatory factor (Ser/Thr protein kinase)